MLQLARLIKSLPGEISFLLLTLQGYTGLPPLDGPNFFRRKRNFLTLTTRESAERFLQVCSERSVGKGTVGTSLAAVVASEC